MTAVTYESIIKQLSGVKEYSTYASALCPMHEDTSPSLMVYRDGWCRCLACGWGGSLVQLQQALTGWVAPTNVKPAPTVHYLPTELNELEGLCMGAHNLLLQYPNPLQEYLQRRGVHNRIVPQHLGYYDGWYSIPCYDRDNNFEGVVMRASPHVQETTGARFNIPKGQPALLYVPDWKQSLLADYFCVVFGMVDALALCELGIPVGTSTSGKDSTNAEMLEWCRKPIVVIPDKGEEQTGRKLVSKLGWRGRLLLLDYPEKMKDPADCVQNNYGQWIINKIEEAIK